jgi:hypothetical protein
MMIYVPFYAYLYGDSPTMFRTDITEKNKTQILCQIHFPCMSYGCRNNYKSSSYTV